MDRNVPSPKHGLSGPQATKRWLDACQLAAVLMRAWLVALEQCFRCSGGKGSPQQSSKPLVVDHAAKLESAAAQAQAN